MNKIFVTRQLPNKELINSLLQKTWNLSLNRAEIILSGVAILEAFTNLLCVKSWLVSPYNLKDGALYHKIVAQQLPPN